MSKDKRKYATSILSRDLPGTGKKVVVAMSGGVDSSVAALILKEQGYETIGLALQVTDYSKYRGTQDSDESGSCCSLSDMEDARRVAEALEIPFYVSDTEKVFDQNVVNYFINDYLQGRTPNPCIMCNSKVKFHTFFRKAMEMGADYIATGHYAQVTQGRESGFQLHMGSDPNKDQSYFLFNLTPNQLEKTLFPLGGMKKEDVRKLADRYDLPVAQKPDSQEICFVPQDNYRKFIDQRTPHSQRYDGLIVTREGIVLGNHDGVHHYTVGQRRGLGAALDLASSMGIPDVHDFHVTRIDPEKRHVVLGPSEDLKKLGLIATNLNWISPPGLHKKRKLQVRIRHRGELLDCTVKLFGNNSCEVLFDKPQMRVSPGQACVFYQKDMCLGGGWILKTIDPEIDYSQRVRLVVS